MAELTDAQKVMRNDTGKRMAAALETLAQNSEAPIGLGMTGATVGQVPVVKTVDENGVPTSYEPGAGGPGLPAGGADGDVLVKNGATDYAARWTNTPPQMGSLAYINTGSTADKLYQPGEYLVYNGQLYKVIGNTPIGQGETLTPGTNISAVDMASTKIGNSAGRYITITDLRPYTTPSAGYVVWDCDPGTAPVGAVTFGGFTFYQTTVTNAAIIMLVPKGAVVETAQSNVVAVTFIPLY